jgi:hypothetical protein
LPAAADFAKALVLERIRRQAGLDYRSKGALEAGRGGSG